MMNFDEFKQNVADHIKDYLPEQYQNAEVTIQEVTKSNDITLSGLMIRTEENNIAPNIYLENFFAQYEDGKDMSEILQDISNVRVHNEMSKGFDVSRITDIDKVRENIICRLVNQDMNAEYLENKPFTPFEDLAVVYAVDLGTREGGRMTAPITNQMMDAYGITTEELHAIAMENLANSHIEFKSMRDTLMEMMGITEDDPQAFMLPPEEGPQMYILTNAEKLDGAATILDAKTMENISEKFNGDFVVLPSSRHEVIILPATEDMDRKVLENMVQDVNAGQVAPEDRLSDHVYQYDAENHELLRMDRLEDRRAEREAAGQEAQKEENSPERSVAEMYDDNQPNLEADKIETSKATKDKPQRTDKVQDKDRTSIKAKLHEKQAEVAKNEFGKEIKAPVKSRDASLE